MRLQVPKPAKYSRAEMQGTHCKSGEACTPMTSDEDEEVSHGVADVSEEYSDDEKADIDGEYEEALNDTAGNAAMEVEDGEGNSDTGTESVSAEDASVATFSAINFTEFVEMYEIDCEYSPEEEAIMWFNSGEYSSFLEQCEEKANEVMKQYEAKGDEIPIHKLSRDLLGLEAWTKEGYKKRQKARLTSIDVVLDEQFAQWDGGKEDPESLAELYRASTEDSVRNANTKAMHLERDVKGFLQSTLKNYDVVRQMSTKSFSASVSSFGSAGSVSSSDNEDLDDNDAEDDVPKKVVPKKKVVKKKTDEWTKVDPNSPQPFNKYVQKKVPPKKKQPSSDRVLQTVTVTASSSRNLTALSSHSSSSAIDTLSKIGSSRSFSREPVDLSDSTEIDTLSRMGSARSFSRGPINITPSPPNSIRSMGSRSKAPPKNKSVGGRRKPAALAAASQLQRQSGARSVVAPKKHQPVSNRSFHGGSTKKSLTKSSSTKMPQLNAVNMTHKKGGHTPMRLPLLTKSKPKSLKFTRSEVLPASNMAVSESDNKKNMLAMKKKALEAELKRVENELTSTTHPPKKKGGMFSKRLLGGN